MVSFKLKAHDGHVIIHEGSKMAAQDPLHFSLPDIHDNPEGWGPGDVAEQVKDTEATFHFRLPEIHDNPDGWGPSDVPEQFKDTPYQPFSKGDRLGKVCGSCTGLTCGACVVRAVSTGCLDPTCIGCRLEWEHV